MNIYPTPANWISSRTPVRTSNPLLTLFGTELYYTLLTSYEYIFNTRTQTWYVIYIYIYIYIYMYRVSQEEWTKLRESVPYVKIYRYNPKHLRPKLDGYGDKGQRKVCSFCGSTYCTWFAWRNTHKLRIVRPCLQLAQARSSLRLHVLGNPKDNYDVSASVL